MNKPACRAYRAAILPTNTAAPVLNLTLRLSLTLTLLLQTPHTLNYRRAARHPNRLHSPFCTKTRSNTAHQQVHNKSYKWSVGFNVNGVVAGVRPTYPTTVTGLFAPKTIRSRERKFQMWNFRSLELSLLGTFAPWNFRSLELSFPETFAPWNFRSFELSLL